LYCKIPFLLPFSVGSLSNLTRSLYSPVTGQLINKISSKLKNINLKIIKLKKNEKQINKFKIKKGYVTI